MFKCPIFEETANRAKPHCSQQQQVRGQLFAAFERNERNERDEMDERSPTLLRPPASFSGLGGEQRLRAELGEIATSRDSTGQKAAALLDPLHRLLRYDAAWIALRDPGTGRHVPVVQDGPTAALQDYFSTDDADAEVQRLGLHRFGWPTPAHRLPVPLEETLAWGEYLLPAGFRDGLAVSLFTEDRRHVGYLILLTSQPNAITATAAALLHTANSLVAAAVDPTPTAATAATAAATISPGRQPLRLKGEDDLIHPGQLAVPLLHDLRLEVAVPILRDLDLHLPGGFGQDGLRSGPVAHS